MRTEHNMRNCEAAPYKYISYIYIVLGCMWMLPGNSRI